MLIDIIRELIKDKSVLILGYGREGRSSWQRIKQAVTDRLPLQI